jgi:hypothetical protein
MVEPYDMYRKRNLMAFEQALTEERERFGHILEDAFNEAAYRPSGDTTDVLLPACGVCVEAPVLIDRLSGAPSDSRQVNLTGIDTLSRRVEIAREHTVGLPGNHLFVTGDAGDLDAHPEIPARFDIALFRRQNCAATIEQEGWRNIFKQAMDRIDPDGVAIVTSLGWDEHVQMIESFQDLGHEPTVPRPILTRYHHESQHENGTLMPIDLCYSVFRKDQVA